MIPGSNILNMALSVIAKTSFNYYAFSSRFKQPNGVYLPTYAPPVALQGSVQPVPRELYQEYGLDFNKYYQNVFVSQNVVDVARDVSGDMVQIQGQMYQCESITPWYGIDGWVQILVVKVQNIPLVTSIMAPASGVYTTGNVLPFVMTFSMPVSVGGTPFIGLSAISGIIGGNAVYSSGSGTNTLTFNYTVAMSDTAAGIQAVSPINGSIISSAADPAVIPANTSFIAPNLTGVILN